MQKKILRRDVPAAEPLYQFYDADATAERKGTGNETAGVRAEEVLDGVGEGEKGVRG